MSYDVIDEAGDVVSTFDDLKDAELYIADNSEHKLEIVAVDDPPTCTQPVNIFIDHSNLIK